MLKAQRNQPGKREGAENAVTAKQTLAESVFSMSNPETAEARGSEYWCLRLANTQGVKMTQSVLPQCIYLEIQQ